MEKTEIWKNIYCNLFDEKGKFGVHNHLARFL